MDRSTEAEQRYGGVNQANMGVPGYQGQYNQYTNLGRNFANRQSQVAGQQGQFGQDVLRREAMGQGVGQQLVRMQAQQAADRASGQQFAAVAGARPGMQAMAARNAMLGSSLAQSQVGGQAALGSANMTLGAQGLYSNHMAGQRGQDISQMQTNDQAQMEAYNQRLKLAGLQQQGGLTAEQLRTSRYNALLGVPTNSEIMMGGLTGLGSAIFGKGK